MMFKNYKTPETGEKVLFSFAGYDVTANTLKKEPWLKYLYITNETKVNVERVTSMEQMETNPILNYVERCFQHCDTNMIPDLKLKNLVIRTLQWSEVSKAGSKLNRKEWESMGLSLDIHNEASAEIYLKESTDDLWTTEIVYALIKTHGLLGQYIRGEVSFADNIPLFNIKNKGLISASELKLVLIALNEAIISAVSVELWEGLKQSIFQLIDSICENTGATELSIYERLSRMFPTAFGNQKTLTSEEETLYQAIIPYHDFWYPQITLNSFSKEDINTIFSIIEREDRKGIKHISFYNFSQSLFYDYEGVRTVNIYKKRIIEMCLKEYAENIEDINASKHVHFVCEKKGNSLFFNVEFTPACESLIQFCVESERSGIMDYQKNITTIFDLFGFRKDVFDRLNNETKYLDTMNSAVKSRKTELLKHVVGNTIVDVGSGGGIFLDLLEETYPDKTIIGTDISGAVIETLNKKIVSEGHKYLVMKHNFVDGPLPEKVDTIIFSSILHEIYSYTEMCGRKFNLEAVSRALTNAYLSLNENGRILIRDGVKCERVETPQSITLKTKEGVTFMQNFVRDFRGLQETKIRPSYDGNVLTADIDYIREFLYTYTWGVESYSCEVNEQFGYYRFDEYVNYLTNCLKMTLIYGECYLEPDYPKHLQDLVELNGVLVWEDLPSNCILIAEKR